MHDDTRRAAPIAVSSSLAGAFLFSDFYFLGIGRVFDYVYLGILALFLSVVRCKVPGRHISLVGIFLLVISPWLIAGALQGSYLLALAITVGLLVAYVGGLIFALNFSVVCDQLLRASIVLGSTVFLFQLLVYQSSGFYIDFTSLVGSLASRGLNENLNYFRASGLFQEPNAFCTVMYCLVSLRALVFGRRDWPTKVGLFSMFLSMSLWGIVAASALIVLTFELKRIALFGVVIVGITALFMIGLDVGIGELSDRSVTIQRVVKLDEDPSRHGRLGRLTDYLAYENAFLGSGVSSNNFQRLGANAFGFLFYSFGLLGSMVCLLALYLLSKGDWRKLAVVGCLFMTFPQFSYMYFWTWLAILFCRAEWLEGWQLGAVYGQVRHKRERGGACAE